MNGPVLPVLHDLSDATFYSSAVEPFLHQFWEFNRVLYGEVTLWTFFKATNPIVSGLLLLLCWTLFILTASVVTENWSWTDRFWSITPTSYVTLLLVWAEATERRCPRLWLFWLLHLVWSVRLTHNYYRKGGYARGSEDYRWRVLSDRMGTTAFVVLQLGYIPVQNLLVAAIALPAYVVLLVGQQRRPLDSLDAFFSFVVLLALAGQTVSDNWQRSFQLAKQVHKEGRKTGFTTAQLDRGFLTAGPFSVSRHPAFLCEQVVWLTFAVWSLALLSFRVCNDVTIGSLAYCALFQASTRLTEGISRSKYPAYARYSAVVGMLLPLPGYRWHEAREITRQHRRHE